MSTPLVEVARLVRRETGMVIGETQLSALAAALGRIAPGMEAERFLAELAAGTHRAALMTGLIDEVTVQESYFFRELRELQAVEWRRLLEESRANGVADVRVWVTACATGEEAYSLAILAEEALGPAAACVSILATDISQGALSRAEAGRYSERSVRNLSRRQRDRHFVREDGHYAVRSSLRAQVRFRRHNLISDSSPPPGEVSFDVIGCRNLFIYFDAVTADRVVGLLESAVRPAGYLILGAADRLVATARRLEGVQVGSGTAQRPGKPERALRRPLGLGPSVVDEQSVEQALLAANEGDLDRALAIIAELLVTEPLNADAYFLRGLAELGLDLGDAAVASFRRALYVDASFGLAAFQLGRAHDVRGSPRAARNAYERALRTLDPDDDRHRLILAQVDLGDIAAACRARLLEAPAERSA